MISVDLARKLRDTGLVWTPAKNDFFCVPDRGMNDKVFVISDMAVLVEMFQGQLSVMFHGTPEWALDHIVVTELVWLPTETQLRSLLEERLVAEPAPAVRLACVSDGYWCEIKYRQQTVAFEAFGANEAYGLALLYILENEQKS